MRLSEERSDLRALAFTIEVDTAYINLNPLGGSQDFWEQNDDSATFMYNDSTEIYVSTIVPQVAVDEPLELDALFVHRFLLRVKDNYEEGIPSDTTCIRFKDIVAYDADGNFVELGGQTVKVTFSEEVPVGSTDLPLVDSGRFQTFPNPTSKNLEVSWQNLTVTEYSVLDLTGKRLQQAQGRWTERMTVDVADFPKGIYFLQLNTTDGTVGETVRFVKM